VAKLARDPITDCDAWHALALGIWSDKHQTDPGVMAELGPLVSKYLSR